MRDAVEPHSYSGPSDLASCARALWWVLHTGDVEWGAACTPAGLGGMEGKNTPEVMWVWENGIGKV